MKNTFKLTIVAWLLCLMFVSCKKSSNLTVAPANALGAGYPVGLNKVITPAILNSLKSDGLKIYAGLTPPTANGSYYVSPELCTYDNSANSAVGYDADDYKYKFSDQNTAESTISVAYEDVSGTDDQGSDGSATYITGTGNSFTIYALTNGSVDSVSYTAIELYSGVLTLNGIANMQLSVYLKSKIGDPANVVTVPVGTARIFIDADSSSTYTTFALSPPKVLVQSLNLKSKVLKMLLSAKRQ